MNKTIAITSAVVGAAATAAVAAFAATAGASPREATTTAAQVASPTSVGLIRLALHNECLTDLGNKTAAGTKVVVWTCDGRNAGQRWTLVSDGTVRVHGAGGQCLTVGNGVLSLGACTGAAAHWLPRADHTLMGLASANAQHQLCVSDPRGSTKNGTQLVWAQCSNLRRQQWSVPGTVYASTRLADRPDSGGSGANWALDTMTRSMSVTALGGDDYEASVIDSGTFVTVPGNATPNQGGTEHGRTLGDALTGSLYGTGGYTFTASTRPAAKTVPAFVQGVGKVSTSDWYQQFFAHGTAFGGAGLAGTGPTAWSWSYASQRDNCGTVETWLDAAPGGGQSASDKDITAPAPGSAC